MFYELSLNLLFFLVQFNILYEILEFSFNLRLDIKRDFLRIFTTIVFGLNVILYYRKLTMMVIASVFVLIILSIQDYKYWRDYWKKIVLYAVYFTLIHIVVFVINGIIYVPAYKTTVGGVAVISIVKALVPA